MSDIIPSPITEGEKKGFSSPDASWFKRESLNFVNGRLRNRSNLIYELVDYKATHSMLDEHLNGTVNRRLLIWSLLSLDAILKLSAGEFK